jgi:cytochrome c oxidase subunit 4
MAHDATWKRLGDGSLLTEDADQGLGHIVEQSRYTSILLTLFVLTGVTVIVGFYDFGSLNPIIALSIATVKALLVACFFMHLKYEKKVILLFAIYPFILLVLLIGGTWSDEAVKHHIVPMTTEGPAPTAVHSAPSHANH